MAMNFLILLTLFVTVTQARTRPPFNTDSHNTYQYTHRSYLKQNRTEICGKKVLGNCAKKLLCRPAIQSCARKQCATSNRCQDDDDSTTITRNALLYPPPKITIDKSRIITRRPKQRTEPPPTTQSEEVTELPDTKYGIEEDENHPCNYLRFKTYPTLKTNSGNKRVSEIQCEANLWSFKWEVKEYDRKMDECKEYKKRRNEPIVGIYGGTNATQGDFPHMGAVGWKRLENDRRNPYKFMCASSLISTRYALTAAHCRSVSERDASDLNGTHPVVVRFGNVYIENTDKNGQNEITDEKIEEFITLNEYNSYFKYNDVALIRLARDVVINHSVRPACLWTSSYQGALNVTGWGVTENSRGSTSPNLLYAEVETVERDSCNKSFAPKISNKFRGLEDHQFCAGKAGGKIDTCQGDSGGPIQIQREIPSSLDEDGLVYYVIGVTSFGFGCAYEGKPGVYVNVSDPGILCWIEKTVWPNEENKACPGPLFAGYHYEKKNT